MGYDPYYEVISAQFLDVPQKPRSLDYYCLSSRPKYYPYFPYKK
ncbi:modification methylase (Eco47II, Sau96I) [Crocosphaera watsonii WH 0402]|uniref:Modification methylase (Eco47II, Sau96I) n=1 Tax=Crocosphaera watsonii WH 0402 TaxID=1284629 RepID=T2JTB2_CROWT|nr:modification methylase (Eco47II, Sau96I) [Crocosphaera watsonii WH 0402]